VQTDAKELPLTEQTFLVHQIHCGSCEQAIRKSLSRLTGVTRVEPDHRINRVTVAFDDARVASDEIAARLEDVGYPVAA
jgi:copper chaperone CopZ